MREGRCWQDALKRMGDGSTGGPHPTWPLEHSKASKAKRPHFLFASSGIPKLPFRVTRRMRVTMGEQRGLRHRQPCWWCTHRYGPLTSSLRGVNANKSVMCKQEGAVGAACKMQVSLPPRPLHLQSPLLHIPTCTQMVEIRL